MRPETLYRKVDRKYVPVALDCTPVAPLAQGIYLVENRPGMKRIQLLRISDVPVLDVAAQAAMMAHVDAAAKAIVDLWESSPTKYRSACAIAETAIRALAESMAQGAPESKW